MDNTNNTNEIKYIPMYKSYIDAVAQLNNEDRLAIYEAIFNYGFTGEEPTFENPYLAMGWNLVKPNLVNNINNAIKNQKNGNKGGRPKKINDGVEPSKPSTENKAIEATISTKVIEDIQLEEIVAEIEDNEARKEIIPILKQRANKHFKDRYNDEHFDNQITDMIEVLEDIHQIKYVDELTDDIIDRLQLELGEPKAFYKVSLFEKEKVKELV